MFYGVSRCGLPKLDSVAKHCVGIGLEKINESLQQNLTGDVVFVPVRYVLKKKTNVILKHELSREIMRGICDKCIKLLRIIQGMILKTCLATLNFIYYYFFFSVFFHGRVLE